jgi:hypothetical protein
VFARPTVDLSANEPEASANNVTFPTQFQTLTTFTKPAGSATRLVLLPGQFFSSASSAKGTQRLFTSMRSRVLFSGSSNYLAPTINSATTTTGSGGVTFTVDATPRGGASVARVLVLFHNAGFSAWSSLDLAPSGGVFTGQTPDADGSLEWFAQVEDSDGNVSVTDDKGELFGSRSTFHASVTGVAGANGWFTGPVTVTATGPAPDYSVWLGDALAGSISTSPFVIPSDGRYVVSVRGTENGVLVIHPLGTVKIDSRLPTAHFLASPAKFSLNSSGPFPIACEDPGGLGVASGVADADCPQGGVTTSTAGGHTLTVTVRDRAGNVASIPLSYSVSATFYGFLQPINDPTLGTPVKSVFKYGSTIPVKFQLKDGSGALMSDAAAQAIATACQAALSYQAAGTNQLATDEALFTSAADSGNCFRYDASAHQFIYNLSSKQFTASSSNWTLTAIVMVGGGEVARGQVTIATK